MEFVSDIDLYIFEKALSRSEIRLIELEDRFYVEDPRIPDTVEMGEAVRLAETAMAQLNGATRMLCPEFHGARIESIVELLSNGTGRGIVSCPITIHGTSDFPAIADFLNSDSAPISSILPALKSDKDVQDALFYLGADGNAWANVYKVTEIVAESTGGKDFVFQKGWCSRTA